jgi:hypothetical protein
MGRIRYCRTTEGNVKDWKAIARASDLGVSDGELERIAGTLEGVDGAFRPLLVELSPDMEPATGFDAEEEESE